jgi:hypothetical protein
MPKHKIYVGFEVLTAVVMKSSIFWDTTPRSPLKVNRRFGETCRLRPQDRRSSRATAELCLPPDFTLTSRSACSSTLRMEATCSSETSVDFQLAIRNMFQKTEFFINLRSSIECSIRWKELYFYFGLIYLFMIYVPGVKDIMVRCDVCWSM